MMTPVERDKQVADEIIKERVFLDAEIKSLETQLQQRKRELYLLQYKKCSHPGVEWKLSPGGAYFQCDQCGKHEPE